MSGFYQRPGGADPQSWRARALDANPKPTPGLGSFQLLNAQEG